MTTRERAQTSVMVTLSRHTRIEAHQVEVTAGRSTWIKIEEEDVNFTLFVPRNPTDADRFFTRLRDAIDDAEQLIYSGAAIDEAGDTSTDS